MRQLMHASLRKTLMRMVRIQQNASARRVIVCEQAGNLAMERTDIDPDAKLQIEDRDDIDNGTRS
jgi:hypothetical protein